MKKQSLKTPSVNHECNVDDNSSPRWHSIAHRFGESVLYALIAFQYLQHPICCGAYFMLALIKLF
jgi:hypothetical protein